MLAKISTNARTIPLAEQNCPKRSFGSSFMYIGISAASAVSRSGRNVSPVM
jgi:hypothetical protein